MWQQTHILHTTAAKSVIKKKKKLKKLIQSKWQNVFWSDETKCKMFAASKKAQSKWPKEPNTSGAAWRWYHQGIRNIYKYQTILVQNLQVSVSNDPHNNGLNIPYIQINKEQTCFCFARKSKKISANQNISRWLERWNVACRGMLRLIQKKNKQLLQQRMFRGVHA